MHLLYILQHRFYVNMIESGTTRKFLIATHGALARGIQSSLDIIIGPVENVFIIQAYLEGNKSIESELAKVLEQVSTADELVIFSDLLGGSVNNQILRFALRERIHIVSGFNLPLVIEIILSDANEPVQEVIKNALVRAKEQMVYVNELIRTQQKENEND
ncbi:MAG TPA: hypothetical protein VFC34_15375 [Puia sp.]|nr:hypothetical protein [Puia sp.]